MTAPAPITQRLLTEPLVPTLLGLATPVVVTTALQAFVAVAELYFISRLGHAALAGATLCLSLVMVMTAVAAGGIGGGISSAVARALGAGCRAEASAIAAHAVWLALICGTLFTVVMIPFGPTLYAALGGTGDTLAAASAYGAVFFAGAIPFWLLNALASVWRGAGQPLVPAFISSIGAFVTLAVSPVLIFGVGTWPGLGVAGAAAGLVLFYVFGVVAQVVLLFTRWAPLPLPVSAFRPQWPALAAILHVGFPASLNALQGNLTGVCLAALIAPFGDAALAGYGAAMRIEFVLIPVVFGLGAGMIPLIGACVGAGAITRARQATWTGAVVAGGFAAIVGCAGALLPGAWMHIFTDQADVATVGSAFLFWVGPAYVAFGAGLALVFAAQGAGQAVAPLLVGTVRLLVAAGGGWLLTRWGEGGPSAVFAALAAAQWTFGLLMAVLIVRTPWRQRG